MPSLEPCANGRHADDTLLIMHLIHGLRRGLIARAVAWIDHPPSGVIGGRTQYSSPLGDSEEPVGAALRGCRETEVNKLTVLGGIGLAQK